MTFEQYWTIILKQWRLVVICFLLVGVGAVIGSKLSAPQYQSTALVEVALTSSNNQSDYNTLLASEQLVQTEAQLAVSGPVLGEVASHYHNLTVEQLTKQVTSSPRLNTQLFEIDVEDSSPTRAASLANDIAQTLIRQQLRLAQQNNLQSQQQIQSDLKNTQQQINQFSAQIASLQAQGGNQAQISTLQTQLSALQQHYSQWQTLLAQLELTQAQSSNFLFVTQPAQPNFVPVKPNLLINSAAGFLGGLFLGILLAILFEQLDVRVRTAEALSQLLGWTVLSTILQVGKGELLINPGGRSTNVEAYRILRTNIGFAGIDKPLKTLLVTSAIPLDGKSVVAANLAIFMAKAGKMTLLIDADLRRPTQQKKFSTPVGQKGLTNALVAFGNPVPAQETFDYQFSSFTPAPVYPSSGTGSATTGRLNRIEVPLEPFLFASDTPNLYIMPSGPLPPNPPELLDSKAMSRFIDALEKSRFEVVIFDTPPVLGLSDTSILASKVDGTLVVVDITRANKRNLQQLKAILEKAGARVLGCVVNKHRRQRSDNLYYYYSAEEQNEVETVPERNPLIPPSPPVFPAFPAPPVGQIASQLTQSLPVPQVDFQRDGKGNQRWPEV